MELFFFYPSVTEKKLMSRKNEGIVSAKLREYNVEINVEIIIYLDNNFIILMQNILMYTKIF